MDFNLGACAICPYQLSHDFILGKPLGVELESVEEIKNFIYTKMDFNIL